MRCFGCYLFLFYFEKAQLGKAGIFWKPAFTPTLPVWRILIALLDKRSHTQTLCFSMVKLNYGLEKRHNMEPVPLPNDILCPGFTDILSVILEKFAIMPVSSAKKSASHFLMSVKYVLEKNVNNFNLWATFGNLKDRELLEMVELVLQVKTPITNKIWELQCPCTVWQHM